MKIVFMGRRAHAVQALAWLLNEGHKVVRVVAPSGTGAERPYWSPTVREFAESRGLAVTDDNTLYAEMREPEAHGLTDIDLVVSFLFWKRIRPSLIELPRFGCINFHPAPLPDYKGLGGYNFAILDKLSEWGVTAHYVDATFDTGRIIEVRRFPFDWRTATAFSLERDARPVTVELFKSVVQRVASEGTLPASVNTGGRYITRADMDGGKRLDLDSMSSEEIDRRVRAFWYPPFQGAYVEVDGQSYTLVSPEILRSLEDLHRETKG